MLIDCGEDTNFHQCQILLQQPGWYLPHTLCWRCVCCAITLLGLYLWWLTSARVPAMWSRKKLDQEMRDHPIPRWVCPSLYCMMHPQHSPIFLFSSSIRGLVTIFSLLRLSELFCILFEICPCRAFTVSHIVTVFFAIIVGGVIKVSSGGGPLLFNLHHTQFFHTVQK